MPPKDIAGCRYGSIKILARRGSTPGGLARWSCQCDCGETFERTGAEIRRSGEANRCRACWQKTIGLKHGATGSYLHTAWMNARRRCRDKNWSRYKDWGGRGIEIIDRWHDSFEVFRDDVVAEIGERPSPEHTLDRADNDGNYEPGNIRWATRLEQMNNRRESNAERQRRIRNEIEEESFLG